MATLANLRTPKSRRGGQPDRELRAAARFALHGDLAAVGADDLAGGRQPQPVADRLGRHERRERPRRQLRVHPAAGVDHVQHHPPVLRLRLQGQRPALRHRVLGVEHQVQEHLLEHLLVQQHRRQVGGRIPVDLDPLRPGGRPQEVQHPGDDLAQVGRLAVQVRHAGEAQEVVGQVHQPPALVGQPGGPVQRLALPRGLRVLEVLGQQLQVQREGVEVVLDLVDEPAGEFREFEVLRLAGSSASSVRPSSVQGERPGHMSRTSDCELTLTKHEPVTAPASCRRGCPSPTAPATASSPRRCRSRPCTGSCVSRSIAA